VAFSIRACAAIAIVLAAVNAWPVSAQAPAPASAVTPRQADCKPPAKPGEALTWTFYAPDQTCQYHIKTLTLSNVTVVGGNDDTSNVLPRSGISDTTASPGTEFVITSGSKGGRTTIVFHHEVMLSGVALKGVKSEAFDSKITVVNQY
jgi:hypothetical protein